jgi:DNA-3-methyladenine glycosylase II
LSRCLGAEGRRRDDVGSGLGRLNVFPGDDVGARNNLARWLNSREPLDYAGVQAAVRGWQPFAGLVYFHLLLANLAERGVLSESSGV